MHLHLYEKGPGFKASFKDFSSTLTASAFGAAAVSTVFGTSVDFIWLEIAQKANWPEGYLMGFLFSIHVFAAFLCWILTFYYKQPIVGACSIPGGIFWGMAAINYSLPDLYGAAVFAGILVLLLGLTGTIEWVMKHLPLPIVMGMTAGVLLPFATAIPGAMKDAPIIAGAAFIAYIVCNRWLKWIPDTIGAVLAGTAVFCIMGSPDFSAVHFQLLGPMWVWPTFNWACCISIGFPLAVLVVGAENAQAIGIMQGMKYDVPVTAMTNYSGVAGIFGAFVGAHNLNIAGPMTAMCASPNAHPDPEKRYGAAFLNGLFYGGIGPFLLPIIAFLQAIPAALISVVAGFAMILCVAECLQDTFKTGKFMLGGFFAFIIGVSNISILHIDAPFWALIVGWLVTYILEHDDYLNFSKGNDDHYELDPSQGLIP